ncbi:holdfast anchoring protein HfaA [Brevundimonas albigilva]|uniref:Holdfast anchoring protein HfaA n=1 Tax=Brevundimonas albigilva TaxID=1312364 RepID=A0ABY4SIT4_9CAUL|nr:holdfast anchoring protein HfaA [Brevundimonas albigilva]UQV18087.1 holdfast anchoring protein HfaA [Brevundimonas albigilva]URI13920.1 holdfast anchoring protein HfaA [Brevundimonas albigilva]
MSAKTLIAASALVAGLLAPALAGAQTAGSGGASQFQQGYGSARSSTTSGTTGSTRDSNGNRLIVDGIIQSGASSYSRQTGGVASAYSGAGYGSRAGTTIGGSTAIGNQLNVVVQGSWNTVIVNSNQTNNGDVTAGTALNGTLDLP